VQGYYGASTSGRRFTPSCMIRKSFTRRRFVAAWVLITCHPYPPDTPVSRSTCRRHSYLLLRRNVKRFRGGLVFEAHRLCVSLNSRLESNKEENAAIIFALDPVYAAGYPSTSSILQTACLTTPRHTPGSSARRTLCTPPGRPQPHTPTRSERYEIVQWFRGGLVFEAHRLLYHSA